jgi:lipopolysaccharide biosynthesis glycosyltransferase
MVLIRAALSKIFPKLDTILSLDVDTIVNEDISDIWDIPLKNYYLAGVREPEKSTENSLYINMGVALFNLKKLRKDKKDNEIIHALNTIQYDYNEQDCINEKCKGAIYELSPDYNVTNYTVQAKHRKIIHYAAIKGWEDLPLVKSYEKRVPIYQPDLSALDIIIPTYNDKKGLIRTLKSIPVRNDVHITVVDDCSPVPYIKEVRKLFPYVTYFQKRVNEGPGMAREFGM